MHVLFFFLLCIALVGQTSPTETHLNPIIFKSASDAAPKLWYLHFFGECNMANDLVKFTSIHLIQYQYIWLEDRIGNLWKETNYCCLVLIASGVRRFIALLDFGNHFYSHS